MINRRQWLVALVGVGLCGLMVTCETSFAKGGGAATTQIIQLAPQGNFQGKGKAKYKVKGSERELQIEAELGRSRRNQTLNFLVNGNSVGTARTNALGKATLNLNTTTGANVPNIVAGSVVEVQLGPNSLRGTF